MKPVRPGVLELAEFATPGRTARSYPRRLFFIPRGAKPRIGDSSDLWRFVRYVHKS